MTTSRLVNRNVVAERGRTSMRLEPELWDMLSEICEREAHDMSTLVRQIEAAGHAGGRTSAVRVYIAKSPIQAQHEQKILDVARRLFEPRHERCPLRLGGIP